MQTAQISIPVDGSQMPAYLARPDGSDALPAVIIFQEIFGVNTEIKRITELVASTGYVGLAINYYHRTHPDLNEPYTDAGLSAGFAAAKQVTRATLTADTNAAIDYLNAQDFVRFNRIATWGFCFGGTVAFYSATLRGVSGAVAFYGGSIASPLPNGDPMMLADADALKAPVLLAFGGKDQYITSDNVASIDSTLAAKHKRYDIQVYPAADHAFFRDSTANMDNKDVADAWDCVQAFLAKNLR